MNANTNTPQPRPLDLAACTCANLRMATRAVTQIYDAALQPSGLKATQLNLLAMLQGMGETPMTRLAEALAMDRTTLTRNLKPLVAKGLVVVEPDTDQRVRRIVLTEAGARALEAALPLWRTAQSRLVDGLGQARWSNLIDDLAHAVTVAQAAQGK